MNSTETREDAFIQRLGRLLFLHDWNKRHPAVEIFDREGLAQWLKDAGATGDNLDPDAYRLVIGDTQVRELGYLRTSRGERPGRAAGHPFTEQARRLLYMTEGMNRRTLDSFAHDPVFLTHVRGLRTLNPADQGVALANYFFPRAVGEQPNLLVAA